MPHQAAEVLLSNLRAVSSRLVNTSRGHARVRMLAVLKHSSEHWLPASPESIAALYEDHALNAPDAYGAASIGDALAIRRVAAGKPTLLLYPVEVAFAPILLAAGVDVAISDALWVATAADLLRSEAKNARLGIHLFVDTGHARSGVPLHQAMNILEAVLHHSDVLELRGIMSHFCCGMRHDGPSISELAWWFLRGSGRSLAPGWPEERLRAEASRVHALQKQRIAAAFATLSARAATHHATARSSLSAPLLHAGASAAVANGESEIFFDMVRIGSALLRGLPPLIPWPGRAQSACMLVFAGCTRGVSVHALKTVPASPGEEWCLSYGCLTAPKHAPLPFLLQRRKRIAILSGVCHEHAEPYFAVSVPLRRAAGEDQEVEVVGDRHGRFFFVPFGVQLNASAKVRPSMGWWS